MKRKILFFDIDGTIFDKGYLPEKNVEMMNRAHDAGHLVMINTGRALAHLPKAVTQAIRFDGFLCALGGYIRLGDRVLKNYVIPEADVYMLCRMMLQNMAEGLGPGRLQGWNYIFHVGKPREDGICIYSEEELRKYPDFQCNKFTFDGIMRPEYIPKLEKNYRLYMTPTYTEGGSLIDNKATSMDVVLREVGMTKADSIAFGDSINDLEMLSAAGMGVVTGNADEETKKHADLVIGDCRDGAVGTFLQEYLKL